MIVLSENVFAVKKVHEVLTGSMTDFDWDANGNLIKSSCVSGSVNGRRLCWTEDNRLEGYTEYSDENGSISAWYNYNAGGDRNFKITTPRIQISQNGVALMQDATLLYPTLYASSLITFNKGGYTKHYFEGSNRVCSKIGGGFSGVDWERTTKCVPTIQDNYDSLIERQRMGILYAFEQCLGNSVSVGGIIDLYEVVNKEHNRNVTEPAYYYHSDHLGSAAYLTNDAGHVTQTLNYLPYGEDWVDIQHYSDTRYPRLGIYTYNGKEKDYESGFHYYGARYYWSEILTGWLSVDPMMDKYPSINPYAYCAWNPVILVDPDGRKIRFAKGTTREQQEKFYSAVRYLDAHNCGGRFGQLQSSDIEYTISIDLTATNCSFNNTTQTITWNPLLGLETDDGDILSPATVLNHEMTHASRYDNIFNKKFWIKLMSENGYNKACQILNQVRSQYYKDNTYVNGESKEDTEIINGIETRTAKLLGEIDKDKTATRSSHREGKLVTVESPTSNQKVKRDQE